MSVEAPPHCLTDCVTAGDYVYDCAWSPQHPALFAAVDGTGRLDLWNLNKVGPHQSVSV